MLQVLDQDTNGRYHRQNLITWWDQSRLSLSKVLVVGAGAIGNEVAKNLALVGVGHVEIVDMDTIEHSNLARCVFFRVEHEGQNKAEVLAKQLMVLNSEITAKAHSIPVQRLGIGYLADFDVIIGALDNREARAWVNQAARKLGKYWIDAAIEGLRGIVRTFGPTGPCYECTLTESDYKQMSHRRSCALLAPEEINSGKTPTNASTAGIVAGVQVQEAIKLLVGKTEMLSLVGKCWVYTGDSMNTYVTGYQADEDCLAHDSYEVIMGAMGVTCINDLFIKAQELLDEKPDAADFEEDLITLLPCATCGGSEDSKLRSALDLGKGRCANCQTQLAGSISTSLDPSDARVFIPIKCFGFAMRDVVTIRSGSKRIHFEIGEASG